MRLLTDKESCHSLLHFSARCTHSDSVVGVVSHSNGGLGGASGD